MKTGHSMKVGTDGKRVSSNKQDMRVTTGQMVVASTGMKRRASSDKQDQHQTKA